MQPVVAGTATMLRLFSRFCDFQVFGEKETFSDPTFVTPCPILLSPWLSRRLTNLIALSMLHFDLFPQGRTILCQNCCRANRHMERLNMECRLSTRNRLPLIVQTRQISHMTIRDTIEMPTSLNSPKIYVH